MKIIFATKNEGKIKEMKSMLADLNFEVMSASEAGILEDIIEDGKTFEENALKKARFISKKIGEIAIADDSGIRIDCLKGKPGVMTARWAGEGASDKDLIEYTLKKLKKIPEGKRQARFESTVALVTPDNKHWIFKGEIKGNIPLAPKGEPRKKLPYDVIFIPAGFKKTFAEMSDKEKNELSHRGLAFKKLKKFLKNYE